MIVVEALTKHFANIKAIDELSFSIPRAQRLALIGPKGAGKSTTMRIISSFLKPSSGRVTINGVDTNHASIKNQIGYLPENIPLYPEMTVYEFLAFIADIRKIYSKKVAIDRVKDFFTLNEILDQPIKSLSKAYKLKVGLAQALIHDPKIVILDEPTKDLDPNERNEFQTLVNHIDKEKTIIFSTNILDEAPAICERIIILAKAQILEDSSSQELLKRGPLNRVFGELTLGV